MSETRQGAAARIVLDPITLSTKPQQHSTAAAAAVPPEESPEKSSDSEKSSSDSGEQQSRVKRVLEEAKLDLSNADLPLKFLSNPVRDTVLKPVLDVACGVLPAVAGVVPYGDDVAAFGLSVPFEALRFTYGLTHGLTHPDDTTEIKIKTIRQDAEDAIRLLAETRVRLRTDLENDDRVRAAQADYLGLKGYVISNTVEILSDPDSKLGEWNEATACLAAYVDNIGLGDELLRVAVGNPRSEVNFRILAHAQAAWDNEYSRRRRTALENPPEMDDLHEIAKMMRYSTAAFGQQMMEAEHVIDDGRRQSGEGEQGEERSSSPASPKKKKKSDALVGSEALKAKVCEHVGIPTSYISYFCMGPGGSMQLLRHFISIDDDLGAVVLAIRGTASFSGWVIDFQGMGRPFCDGVAHKGMADMADAILANSKDEILRALRSKPSYRLLITGESLGGGVSPLVNILCHLDDDINKYSIKAHPFAGPPVYYQTSPNVRVDQAIANCTAYIHRDDIVPHCSVSSVQRLLAKLSAIDAVTSTMSVLDRRLMAAGRRPPSEALAIAALDGDANVVALKDAPVLYMPAASVVWFCAQEEKEDERADADGGDDENGSSSGRRLGYNVIVCDAKKVAALGLPLSINMTTDHPPYVYERALNEVERTPGGWEILSPPAEFKDIGNGSVAAFA